MKMKRGAVVFLAAMLVLGTTGCGDKEEVKEAKEEGLLPGFFW